MQHLLGTCCSNVQDHAAKQIDWFLYFQFFTSSTPSETMRSSGSKAGCGKSNIFFGVRSLEGKALGVETCELMLADLVRRYFSNGTQTLRPASS
mmetsp:Transcript_53497/g.116856  ORF Transcript_53497/g.116856 Transcript_53497/m.116856 type:complete len:94 (+) Transcript_53497:205-486(+)